MEHSAVSSAGMLARQRFFLDDDHTSTVTAAQLARNRDADNACPDHQKITDFVGHDAETSLVYGIATTSAVSISTAAACWIRWTPRIKRCRFSLRSKMPWTP